MEKPRERRLVKLFTEFAENTTAHGIGRIVSSTSHFWRLLWALSTMACFGMVLYQGIILLQTYLMKPVKSDFDVTYSRVVNFPAVTICNMNIVKISELKSRFAEIKETMSRFETFAKPATKTNPTASTSSPQIAQNKTNSSGISPSVASVDSIVGSIVSGGSVKPTLPVSGKSGGRRRRKNTQDSDESSSSFGPPDKMKEALKKGLTSDSSGSNKLSLKNVSFDTETYVQDQMLAMLAELPDSELKKAGHPFGELVYRCTWNGFSCNQGDFMQYWSPIWNWRYGNCYMFNSGLNTAGEKATVLTSAKPGPQYGLTLDLFINQDEYVPPLSQEAGVRILLKTQQSIPFPVTEGFTVAPGNSVSMGIRKLAINRVDPFNNHSCWDEDNKEEWSIYDRFKGSVYSVQGCMISCLARAQMESCKCTQGKYRFGEKICRNDSEVECVMGVVSKYDDHQLGCIEKCPQPCSQVSYRTTISTATWARAYEKQMQMLMKKRGDKTKDKFANDRDMLSQNFVRVKIYFDELNLESITYSEYYAIENLLGDVGGQMGLWIGISVLTLTEFLKLLYDAVLMLLARLCRTGQTEVRDINLTENKRN